MPEIDDALMHSAIRKGGMPFGHPDWEDACQEARLKRWQYRDRPKPIQWIGIRNVTVDGIRRRLGRHNQRFYVANPLRIETDEGYVIPIPAPEELEAVLDRATLAPAFQVLSRKEAYATWKWASGYCLHEIAEALHCSKGWVTILVRRSLIKMREELTA